MKLQELLPLIEPNPWGEPTDQFIGRPVVITTHEGFPRVRFHIIVPGKDGGFSYNSVGLGPGVNRDDMKHWVEGRHAMNGEYVPLDWDEPDDYELLTVDTWYDRFKKELFLYETNARTQQDERA